MLPAIGCLLSRAGAESPSERWTRHQYSAAHMGTSFVIVVFAPHDTSLEPAVQAAFARIAELDSVLSNYRVDSKLNQFCDTAPHATPVRLGDDMWYVLSRSLELAKLTDGAFDVTVGPLTKLWRRARRRGELPDDRLLQAARERTGCRFLHLDIESQSAQLGLPGMQIDLGAIAKGYAADEALRVLREHGWSRASVDAGGDFALGDPPPGKAGWRIAIASTEKDQPPTNFLTLANRGAATSGDLWQFSEIDGQRYSHILDPRTGIGLTTRTSATVIAQNCTTADSLASAAVVLGVDRGIALIEEMHGTEVSIVTPDGEQSTAGF